MTRRIDWLLGGIACALAVLMTMLVLFKLDHIQFMMLSRLPDLPKISVEDFPQDLASDPSCRLTWQGLEMNIPGWSAERSHAEVKMLNSAPLLLLSPERKKGAKGMIVNFPLDATPPPGPAMFETPPPEQDWPESHASSIVQLAEMYRVCRSDFRWSSSRSEVRRLRWLLLNAGLRRVNNAERVFVNKSNVLEGILIVTDTRYIYEWRTADTKIAGEILFVGKEWKDHEKLVFSVCRSVTITEPATRKTPLKPTLEDLQKSLRVHCNVGK